MAEYLQHGQTRNLDLDIGLGPDQGIVYQVSHPELVSVNAAGEVTPLVDVDKMTPIYVIARDAQDPDFRHATWEIILTPTVKDLSRVVNVTDGTKVKIAPVVSRIIDTIIDDVAITDKVTEATGSVVIDSDPIAITGITTAVPVNVTVDDPDVVIKLLINGIEYPIGTEVKYGDVVKVRAVTPTRAVNARVNIVVGLVAKEYGVATTFPDVAPAGSITNQVATVAADNSSVTIDFDYSALDEAQAVRINITDGAAALVTFKDVALSTASGQVSSTIAHTFPVGSYGYSITGKDGNGDNVVANGAFDVEAVTSPDILASFDGASAAPAGWTLGGSGTLATDGAKLYASDYGPNTGAYRGPSLEKLVGTVTDFDLEVALDWIIPTSGQYHILNILLLDDANYKVANLYLVSDSSNDPTIGFYFQNQTGVVGGGSDRAFSGVLRLVREGTTISAYKDGNLIGTVQANLPAVTKIKVDIQQFDGYGGGTVKIDNLTLASSAYTPIVVAKGLSLTADTAMLMQFENSLDLSGNLQGVTVTPANSAYADAGEFGKAFQFVHANNRQVLIDHPDLNRIGYGTNIHRIDTLMRGYNQTSTGTQTFLWCIRNVSGNNEFIWLDQYVNGTVVLGFYDSVAATSRQAYSTGHVYDGTQETQPFSPTQNQYINDASFHLVTAIIDMANNMLVLYIDGVKHSEVALPANFEMAPGNQNLMLGSIGPDAVSVNYTSTFDLASFRIQDLAAAPSDAEILAEYRDLFGIAAPAIPTLTLSNLTAPYWDADQSKYIVEVEIEASAAFEAGDTLRLVDDASVVINPVEPVTLNAGSTVAMARVYANASTTAKVAAQVRRGGTDGTLSSVLSVVVPAAPEAGPSTPSYAVIDAYFGTASLLVENTGLHQLKVSWTGLQNVDEFGNALTDVMISHNLEYSDLDNNFTNWGNGANPVGNRTLDFLAAKSVVGVVKLLVKYGTGGYREAVRATNVSVTTYQALDRVISDISVVGEPWADGSYNFDSMKYHIAFQTAGAIAAPYDVRFTAVNGGIPTVSFDRFGSENFKAPSTSHSDYYNSIDLYFDEPYYVDVRVSGTDDWFRMAGEFRALDGQSVTNLRTVEDNMNYPPTVTIQFASKAPGGTYELEVLDNSQMSLSLWSYTDYENKTEHTPPLELWQSVSDGYLRVRKQGDTYWAYKRSFNYSQGGPM